MNGNGRNGMGWAGLTGEGTRRSKQGQEQGQEQGQRARAPAAPDQPLLQWTASRTDRVEERGVSEAEEGNDAMQCNA